ncbi:unnamed protein product [Macrosiphum euphorbiae]|uniref:RING-type domain-containing protein n=1 Tax=Macrosiphum euphorbiae TaxID=13131 RepID=A0AAV0XU48_9HEMI|nr:unnamed protein product [Macrosiphum euphorbiae]
MTLPLLPQNLIMEGFESIKRMYRENELLSLGDNGGQFNQLFDYYRSTWLQGVNADMLSVNETVWRTNNVLEVSHQHLLLHMGNRHHPEPWIFLKGLITYSRGILIDYTAVTDGEQIREPQRQVWIDNQRRLDLAMRLLNEGRYSILEFLVCSRHATANFGVLRPQPLQIQPVNDPQPQPLHIEPAINVPRPPSPILFELPPHPSREEILARLLPARIRQPVPANLFDVSSDSDDNDENVIAVIPRANQIENEDFNILENSDSNDEENVMARSQAIRPHTNWIHGEDLTITPIVESQCYICIFSPPTVIVLPCMHQGLCEPCFTSYSTMAPYSRQPYYRCPLCRGQVESYLAIQ